MNIKAETVVQISRASLGKELARLDKRTADLKYELRIFNNVVLRQQDPKKYKALSDELAGAKAVAVFIRELLEEEKITPEEP